LDFLTGLRSVALGLVGEGDRRSASGCGVLGEYHGLALLLASPSAAPAPLSAFIETSLREQAAIAARSNASWRRLAFLPKLPFGVGVRGPSLTWRFVGVGVETLGTDGGAGDGVAGLGEGVAGTAVGGGGDLEGDGSVVEAELSFVLLLVRLLRWKTMFVSDCDCVSDGDGDGDVVPRPLI
jgi:hypothetical protein